MDRFSDDREALDFIASRIADEAQRDVVPLSEVERKMLYFSETAWTLPEIWTVTDEFDQNYERSAYEKKISQLIKKAVSRVRKHQNEEFDAWIGAVRQLSKHDRYLLVMIKQAGLGRTFRSARSSSVRWRLWGSWGIVLVLFATFTWILKSFNPQPGAYLPRSGIYGSPLREVLSFSIWAFLFCLAIGIALLRLLLGAEKISEVSIRWSEWIHGRSRRTK